MFIIITVSWVKLKFPVLYFLCTKVILTSSLWLATHVYNWINGENIAAVQIIIETTKNLETKWNDRLNYSRVHQVKRVWGEIKKFHHVIIVIVLAEHWCSSFYSCEAMMIIIQVRMKIIYVIDRIMVVWFIYVV